MSENKIEFTDGEDDPVFNGIYIKTGCKCDGYNCDKICLEYKNNILRGLLK